MAFALELELRSGEVECIFGLGLCFFKYRGCGYMCWLSCEVPVLFFEGF